MGFFSRVFKIGQAEANSALDSIEDPVKMTEQAIRDLKVDLDKSIKALAEVKALAIRNRNEVEQHRSKAKDYEGKAIMLIKRAETGALDPAEADRLATIALDKKEESIKSLAVVETNQKKFDSSVSSLEANVRKLKSNISKWENEARTLKARAKVSAATKNVNKQLAQIDSSSTVSMLERMKEKVEQEEALADSYADIADDNTSLDDEIESALEGAGGTSDALAALKSKLSLKENNPE